MVRADCARATAVLAAQGAGLLDGAEGAAQEAEQTAATLADAVAEAVVDALLTALTLFSSVVSLRA